MRYAWDLKKDGSSCEWSDMLMNSILEREREYNIKNNANSETVLFPVERWKIRSKKCMQEGALRESDVGH